MKKTCEHQDIAESQVMCAHVAKFSGWEKYEKDKTKETLSNVVKLETRLS